MIRALEVEDTITTRMIFNSINEKDFLGKGIRPKDKEQGKDCFHSFLSTNKKADFNSRLESVLYNLTGLLNTEYFLVGIATGL